MNKKVYRIRRKSDNEFISLGHNNKSSWLSYPSQAIKYSHIEIQKDNFEVVIFELKEIDTKPLR